MTVGAQMPFDRLIRTVDEWAGRRGRSDVFAQIGSTDFRPRNIEWVQSLDRAAFDAKLAEADVLVGHAGMGSIISAMEMGRPILVMPRRGDLMETRNDHQLATARHLQGRDGLTVAMDEKELAEKLDSFAASSRRASGSACASAELLTGLRDFIAAGRPSRHARLRGTR